MTCTDSVRRLQTVSSAQIGELSSLLIDCVEGGASVGFMHPLERSAAVAFWTSVASGVASGARALLVAEDAVGICGTAQLVLALPPNQPHRADVSKVLVHRRARRRGVGAALMRAAEATARECGRALLVLDTVTGGDAQRGREPGRARRALAEALAPLSQRRRTYDALARTLQALSAEEVPGRHRGRAASRSS